MKPSDKLHILIVEDEARIARRIERLTTEILQERIAELKVENRLGTGLEYVRKHRIDLMILDLNLAGEDGFRLLQTVAAESFATIIISAYRNRALEAFEYGVLDFIAKPFRKERLEKAFRRVLNKTSRSDHPVKYLPVKKQGRIILVRVEDLLYIQGANIYAELHLKNGQKELSDKSLESIFQLLPAHFARIHRSYIANMNEAAALNVEAGGKYQLLLRNEQSLPIGRTRYKELKAMFFHSPEGR